MKRSEINQLISESIEFFDKIAIFIRLSDPSDMSDRKYFEGINSLGRRSLFFMNCLVEITLFAGNGFFGKASLDHSATKGTCNQPT